jgi:hypothetical protein
MTGRQAGRSPGKTFQPRPVPPRTAVKMGQVLVHRTTRWELYHARQAIAASPVTYLYRVDEAFKWRWRPSVMTSRLLR